MNYEENKNDSEASNTFGFALKGFKEHAKGQGLVKHRNLCEQVQNQVHEQTITKPLAVEKIKINFDEEQTRKICWNNGISNLAVSKKKEGTKQKRTIQKVQPKMQAESNPQQFPIEIPYNKKVEQIMNKKPLRQRFSHILPTELQLPISFDHQQLLRRMQLIDRCIQFLSSHRNIKIFFFQTIKKSIYETNSIVIQHKTFQQLLYLDENCYAVQWKLNQKNKRHDLKIMLPKIESMDLRKTQMRKKIVKFLIFKEGQFLAAKKLTKIQNNRWHQLFDYKKIGIPMKSLPVHPNSMSTDLRAFPEQQIEKVDNTILKNIFKTKKQMQEVKSISGASVADMIFSRVPASQISNQIIAMVREKQRKNNEQMEKKKIQNQKLDKESMLKIFDQILLIYMSKNVSSIFKATLIDILQQRIRFKDDIVAKYLEKLLEIKDLNFFKIVESSKKLKVIQIDKQKFKEARQIIQSSL